MLETYINCEASLEMKSRGAGLHQDVISPVFNEKSVPVCGHWISKSCVPVSKAIVSELIMLFTRTP